MSSHLLYVSGTPLVPDKIGPARRNRHVLHQLTRFFDVTVATVGEAPDARTLAHWCDDGLLDVHIISRPRSRVGVFARKLARTALRRHDYLPALHRELARLVDRLLRGEGAIRADAVVCSHTLLAELPIALEPAVIIDAHNVEHAVHARSLAEPGSAARRLYAGAQHRPTRDAELRCFARADLVLATSDRDRDRIVRCSPTADVAVVPNGIDLQEFTLREHEPAARSIVFTGLLSYYPNQQGLRWFIERVLPLVRQHDATIGFVVAGAQPPRWLRSMARDGLVVTGPLPDMRPVLSSASVAVVPLHVGGGTRVKILEAQAVGVPVVSTTVGAEGLTQRAGETILIADEPAEFAAAVIELLNARERARRLSAAARACVAQYFDWDRIGVGLARSLQSRLGLSGRSLHTEAR